MPKPRVSAESATSLFAAVLEQEEFFVLDRVAYLLAVKQATYPDEPLNPDGSTDLYIKPSNFNDGPFASLSQLDDAITRLVECEHSAFAVPPEQLENNPMGMGIVIFPDRLKQLYETKRSSELKKHKQNRSRIREEESVSHKIRPHTLGCDIYSDTNRRFLKKLTFVGNQFSYTDSEGKSGTITFRSTRPSVKEPSKAGMVEVAKLLFEHRITYQSGVISCNKNAELDGISVENLVRRTELTRVSIESMIDRIAKAFNTEGIKAGPTRFKDTYHLAIHTE